MKKLVMLQAVLLIMTAISFADQNPFEQLRPYLLVPGEQAEDSANEAITRVLESQPSPVLEGEGSVRPLLPDPCENAIWHNGEPDCNNGIACERRLDGSLTAWSVDDATFEGDIIATAFHWWTIDAGAEWVGLMDYIIMTEINCGPADTVAMEFDIPASRVDSGLDCFGLPNWLYSVEGLSIELPAGTYFIGLRPVTAGPSGQSFWATLPPSGCLSWFWGPDFGYDEWTECDPWFGCYDVAFCVTGLADCAYVPADVNGNGSVNVVDITALVNWLTAGQQPAVSCNCPPSWEPFYPAADVNGNCEVNVVDITALVNWLVDGVPVSFCEDCPPVE